MVLARRWRKVFCSIMVHSLEFAGCTGYYQGLTRAKGVGPKLAKRLVIDLKDKVICKAQPDLSMQSTHVIEMATEALMKLGFNESRAKAMLTGAEGMQSKSL